MGIRSSYKERKQSQSNIEGRLDSMDELNIIMDSEPTPYVEAKNIVVWRQDMQNKFCVIFKNGTWELVDPPLDCKPTGCKWIFRRKYKVYGSLEKHKYQLGVKGYAQKRAYTMMKSLHLQ